MEAHYTSVGGNQHVDPVQVLGGGLCGWGVRGRCGRMCGYEDKIEKTVNYCHDSQINNVY